MHYYYIRNNYCQSIWMTEISSQTPEWLFDISEIQQGECLNIVHVLFSYSIIKCLWWKIWQNGFDSFCHKSCNRNEICHSSSDDDSSLAICRICETNYNSISNNPLNYIRTFHTSLPTEFETTVLLPLMTALDGRDHRCPTF